MTSSAWHVLFVCTGNSARSILAESILKREGGERFVANSAGSFPKGEVHPMALRVLRQQGYDTSDLRSKSWDEFGSTDSPPIDLVVTVCDEAAGEVCPVWPGGPLTVHWGMPDPAAVTHSEAACEQAFLDTYDALCRRIRRLVSLPLATLDRQNLIEQITGIGSDA